MENEPDTENVLFIDEYPELKKRVWLRRLNAHRQMGQRAIVHEIIYLPDMPQGDPDGAA